jgi:hypothetical protein
MTSFFGKRDPTFDEQVMWAARTIYALRAVPFDKLINVAREKAMCKDNTSITEEIIMLTHASSAVSMARSILGVSDDEDTEVANATEM